MLVWHARDCMYCAVRTLKVNGWYLTFPAGEGKKGAVIPYFLLLPRPIRLAIRGRNTHTHTRSLPLQIPPAGLSLLAKRENSPLVPRKGPASIFSQCGQREKAFIWQQQKNRTRDRNCAKLYVNQCVVQFCIFQRLGSTAASPTMSPRWGPYSPGGTSLQTSRRTSSGTKTKLFPAKNKNKRNIHFRYFFFHVLDLNSDYVISAEDFDRLNEVKIIEILNKTQTWKHAWLPFIGKIRGKYLKCRRSGVWRGTEGGRISYIL